MLKKLLTILGVIHILPLLYFTWGVILGISTHNQLQGLIAIFMCIVGVGIIYMTNTESEKE